MPAALFLLAGCYTEGSAPSLSDASDRHLYLTRSACVADANDARRADGALVEDWECRSKVLGMTVVRTAWGATPQSLAADSAPPYRLFRSALTDNRVYVASFDAGLDYPPDFNLQACERTMHLYQAQRGSSESYWCERKDQDGGN